MDGNIECDENLTLRLGHFGKDMPGLAEKGYLGERLHLPEQFAHRMLLDQSGVPYLLAKRTDEYQGDELDEQSSIKPSLRNASSATSYRGSFNI